MRYFNGLKLKSRPKDIVEIGGYLDLPTSGAATTLPSGYGFIGVAASQMIAVNTELERVDVYCAADFTFDHFIVSVWRLGEDGVDSSLLYISETTAQDINTPGSATAGTNISLRLAVPLVVQHGDLVGIMPINASSNGFITDTYIEDKNVLAVIDPEAHQTATFADPAKGVIRMRFYGRAPDLVMFGETDPTGILMRFCYDFERMDGTTPDDILPGHAYPMVSNLAVATITGINDIKLSTRADYTYSPGHIISSFFTWSWAAMGSYFENIGVEADIALNTQGHCIVRFERDVINRKPSYAILQMGRHDVTTGEEDEVILTLEWMVNRCIANDITPIVVAVPPARLGGIAVTIPVTEERLTNVYDMNASIVSNISPLATVIDPSPVMGTLVGGAYYNLNIDYAGISGSHLNKKGYGVMAKEIIRNIFSNCAKHSGTGGYK